MFLIIAVTTADTKKHLPKGRCFPEQDSDDFRPT